MATNSGMQNSKSSNEFAPVLSGYTNGQSQAGMSSGVTQKGGQGSGQGQATLVGVFSSYNAAENAVNALRKNGFNQEEISIISKDDKRKQGSGEYNDDITDGALTGGTIGGLGGLLLGAGALAIPGLGPIIAAGPIAAALSGAVAGGIAGGLIDWGIPAEASQRYESHIAQGGILAIIRTDSSKINQASAIFNQNGARDIETH